MKPVLLTYFTTTSCLGRGLDATLDALRGQRDGLAPCTFPHADFDTWIGEVPGADTAPVRADLTDFNCHSNGLAQISLTQGGFAESVEAAKTRHGTGRVGIFIGTSTSGILETERIYQQRDLQTDALPASFHYAQTHSIYSPTTFVRVYFGLSGPAAAISSACSSGVKVFASARRMLTTGLIDVAVVGSVDSLCLTALYRLNSLELLSRQPCQPYNVARDSVSIGEAAVFALLEHTPEANDALNDSAILLLGIGESSDAYHMSSPHPEGLGARAAMAQALTTSSPNTADIDYISLHSIGTPNNDATGSHAIQTLFHGTARSSVKGTIGRTLGAAGALEAVITALALRHQFLPAGVNAMQPDPALVANYLAKSSHARVHTALGDAFGFGGTDCSLVFGRTDHLGLPLRPDSASSSKASASSGPVCRTGRIRPICSPAVRAIHTHRPSYHR